MKFDLSQDFSGRRCTKRDEYGNADIKGVDMQFMLGLDYEQMNTMQIALNRLADFEDAQTHDKRTETHGVCSYDLISRNAALALVVKAIHGTDNKDIKDYLFGGLRKQLWALPSAIEKGCDSCRFDNRYGEESICSSCARHYSDCYAPQEEGGEDD